MAIEPQFNTGYAFSEGRALINVDNRWGYIDKKGRTVIPAKFLQASSFANGLAQVHTIENTAEWRGSRWFYIDKNGKIVRSQRPREPATLVNGFAPSKWNGIEWTLIDETGEVVFHPQFDTDQISVVEYPRVYPCSREICIESFAWDSEMGYIDKTGKFIWKPTK